MKCPGCKLEVELPHKCRMKDGKRFTLTDPSQNATSIDDMNDEGPEFSSGPENYDPDNAAIRIAGADDDFEEHA